jgi:hypothetical protein
MARDVLERENETMALRFPLPLLALVVASVAASAASRQMTWEELPAVVGKTVSIALPRGASVQGKVSSVTPDYLELDVRKTSLPALAPKGALRIPRAELHSFDLHGKGKLYRVLFTSLGCVVGFVGGVVAAFVVDGGILSNDHQNLAPVTLFAIWGGASVAGYFAGNAVDRKTVVIRVVP